MKYLSAPLLIVTLLTVFASCKEAPKKETVKNEGPLPMDKNSKLLVGTFAEGEGQGIYQLEFNTKTGELTNRGHLVKENKPGYLALSKDGKRVYASNGTAPGSISTFTWNVGKNQLQRTQNLASEGNGACYIALSPKEDLIAAANYGSGGIVLYHLDKNGRITEAPQATQHQGSGPHKNQKSAHAHCVEFSVDGAFLYAVDLGIDKILAYPIGEGGKLEKEHTAMDLDPGDGPRHLIFQPGKNRAFVINELGSSVVSAEVDPQTGTFTKIDKKSTLPEDYKGPNACADIHLSRDGKFLYASNRGHNSISVFEVSGKGQLKLLATEPVQGDWPRNFALSPDDRYLLVANRKSDNISVFKRNGETGLLTFTGHQIGVPQPVCLKFR